MNFMNIMLLCFDILNIINKQRFIINRNSKKGYHLTKPKRVINIQCKISKYIHKIELLNKIEIK